MMGDGELFMGVLVFGLYILILYQELRIRRLENGRGPAEGLQDRDFDAVVERIIMRPQRPVETWALTLWRERSSKRRNSRGYMIWRRMLTKHQWDSASLLLHKIGVSTETHTYEAGIKAIQKAEDEQHRLSEMGRYVSPTGQSHRRG